MKKNSFIAALFLAVFSFSNSNAQAFEKGGKYLNLNLGVAQMWHFGGDLPNNGYGGFFGYSPITGQFGVQMEFGIHDYVGIGFTTGVGGGSGLGGNYYYTSYAPEVNVPFGAIANFHFFQLIADKTGKDIHADKLDVYAGLNVGSGAGILFPKFADKAYFSALFFIGPQAGVRYFFNDKISVNGEIGYGKSFFNAGITFKL